MEMKDIFEPIGKTFFYAALMGIGIALWLILERFSVIPPTCILDEGAYSLAQDVMHTSDSMAGQAELNEGARRR